MLRCILTEGEVYLDGLPTSSINLDALRTSITIIPQMVTFFLISIELLLIYLPWSARTAQW